MKNSKLLIAMMTCGTILFGCGTSQNVNEVVEPKVEQEVEVTEEDVAESVEEEAEVKEQPVEEQPIEQEVSEPIIEVEEEQPVIEEQPKAEYEGTGIWGDSKPNYEDLQTTKIELVKNSDNEVVMIYNGTIQDYADDVARETTGDCINYELTSQLLMVAFCSMDEAEIEFTLVDNEGTVIYKYLDGEPVVNGLEKIR